MSYLATVLSRGSSDPQDQTCAVLPLPHWPLLLKPLVPAALAPTLPFPKHCTGPAGPSLGPSWRHGFHPFVNHTSENVKLVLFVTQPFIEGHTVPMT